MDVDSDHEPVQQNETPTGSSDLVDFRSTTPDVSIEVTPHPSPSKSTNANGKRALRDTTTFQGKRRRAEHLAAAKRALQAWRLETFSSLYSPSSFTAVAILPDDNLTTLASDAQIKTLEDLSVMLKPRWILAKKHGQEILDLLKQLDEDEMRRRQNSKRAKKEVKDREKEAKRQQKEWDKENERTKRARQKEIDQVRKSIGNTAGSVLLPLPVTNSLSISSTLPPTVSFDIAPQRYQYGFVVAPAGGFFSTYPPNAVTFPSIPPAQFYSNHSTSTNRTSDFRLP